MAEGLLRLEDALNSEATEEEGHLAVDASQAELAAAVLQEQQEQLPSPGGDSSVGKRSRDVSSDSLCNMATDSIAESSSLDDDSDQPLHLLAETTTSEEEATPRRRSSSSSSTRSSSSLNNGAGLSDQAMMNAQFRAMCEKMAGGRKQNPMVDEDDPMAAIVMTPQQEEQTAAGAASAAEGGGSGAGAGGSNQDWMHQRFKQMAAKHRRFCSD